MLVGWPIRQTAHVRSRPPCGTRRQEVQARRTALSPGGRQHQARVARRVVVRRWLVPVRCIRRIRCKPSSQVLNISAVPYRFRFGHRGLTRHSAGLPWRISQLPATLETKAGRSLDAGKQSREGGRLVASASLVSPGGNHRAAVVLRLRSTGQFRWSICWRAAAVPALVHALGARVQQAPRQRTAPAAGTATAQPARRRSVVGEEGHALNSGSSLEHQPRGWRAEPALRSLPAFLRLLQRRALPTSVSSPAGRRGARSGVWAGPRRRWT